MRKLTIVACFLVLSLAACGNTGTASTPPAPVATQAPTHVPTATPVPHVAKWVTVQTFTGPGSKKTKIFQVSDDWKMVYTCAGGSYGSFLSATIYDNNNAYVSSGINVACDAGKTVKGETEEHQAGEVYLDITGTDQWSIVVQVLK